MNKKIIKQISIAAFIIVIILLIIIPRINSKKEDKAGGSGIKGAIISAAVKIAKPKSFDNTLNVSGSIIANEEVDLRTESSGKITGIFFTEGTFVKKGDLLLKVNDADLQAELKKAEIKKKDSEEKEYRQKVLLSKNGISKETYEEAVNNLNSAIADIENIKALIAKTEIRAPFDGKIGLRYVSEGSYITSSTQIAKLQNISSVKVDFTIPQRFAKEISVGNTVSIQTATGEKYNAKIYAIEPKINPETRSLQVRAVCSNTAGGLLPGGYVSVIVTLDAIKNAITVPTEAMSLDITGERVFLYKNGIAIPKKIESGVRTEKEVLITNGISVGDTVIVSGIMQMRPRAKVKIISVEQD